MIGDDIDEECSECPNQYICVIDFEATCLENMEKDFYLHEIIEFPAVLINTQTCSIVSTFHSFVKPTINPQLSDFCKTLTGISQDTINDAETFDLVFPRFLEWLYSFAKEDSFIILTDGSWDMTKFLYLQCLISHLEFPSWAERFIDIKLSFKMYNKKEKTKLTEMLEAYGLTFEGQLHSGKDDAYNIARLALAMLKSKHYLACNAEMHAGSKKYLERQLSAFFRKKQSEQRARKREANKQKKINRKKAHLVIDLGEEFIDRPMDIDPDLEGSEYILMKHKSK